MAKTTRQSFQFMLRLPDELRDRLRRDAEKNGRSVTAEIIKRLEETIAVDDADAMFLWLPPHVWKRLDEEANLSQTHPSLLVIEAVEKAYPAVSDVPERLRALGRDVSRLGIENTPEGKKVLAVLEELIAEREPPSYPWKKD